MAGRAKRILPWGKLCKGLRTGSICTVTNEGNADLSGNVPKLQIHSIGIEKLMGL